MITIRLLLLILSFLCFAAAAGGVQARVGLLPLGLALWVLSLLVT